VERARLGYVIVDDARATPALRAFAVEAFGLQHVQSSDGYSLYVPRLMPVTAGEVRAPAVGQRLLMQVERAAMPVGPQRY
jgi:hypothetical protein